MTSHHSSTLGCVNSVARCRLIIGFAAAVSTLVAQAAGASTTTLAMQAQKDYFSEKCFTLEQGQQISYEFKTRYAIEFNLHHHPADGDTVFPDRLVVKSQHSKTVVAEYAGTYCFMATNLKDQPGDFDVVIKYEITK